jgi:hypothetical protein
MTIAVALLLAACGGAQESGPEPATTGAVATSATPSAGAPIPESGLTIEEALASTLEGALLVKGHLVAAEGAQPRLCTALLESYPPQCGEPSLAIEGLDLSALEGLSHTEDPSLAQVTWSDGEISLLGPVEDGTLTVSGPSNA